MDDEEDPGKSGDIVDGFDPEVPQEPEVESGNFKTPVLHENGKIDDAIRQKIAKFPESEMPAAKKIKLTDESNSADTAETIKKIQAFIALGKCDESKKEPELQEKQVSSKTSSKKILESRENQDDTGEVDKINNISELQRTLQGLDDSLDNSSNSERGGKSLPPLKSENKKPRTSVKDNNRDVKAKEVSPRNSDLNTPSRVSKRIQSKSIKFSAKKLLSGDDSGVLRRKIPGYEKEKRRSHSETLPKNDLKKYHPSKAAVLEDDVSEESASENNLSDSERPLIATSVSNISQKKLNSPSKLQANSNIHAPISPKISSPEEKHKSLALAEQLTKLAANSGKITLELKGMQKKKVVRIAVPPPTSSPMPKASLGPDIIIKRVKPVKKTVSSSENVKETIKTPIRKEVDLRSQSINIPEILKMSPRVSIERIPIKKLKDDIVKIQKNIIKSGMHEDPKTVMSVKFVNFNKPSEKSVVESKPSRTSHQEVEKSVGSIESKKTDSEEPSLNQQISEALEISAIQLDSHLDSGNEDLTLRKLPQKRGRKPLKNLSSTGNKSKLENFPRRPGRPRKEDREDKDDEERSPSESDVEEPPAPSEDFNALFDRYFSTHKRYIEHHDSLDSDSSADFDNEIYTHFINLKNRTAERKHEDATVYDLMHDISIELPTWNIHASSNGDVFYLVQIDGSNEKPIMKKVVELDLDNNAKVYVDDKLLPEYEGNYASYEEIRQLIYDIDQM